MSNFASLCKDETGATAIEYGLLAALVAIVLIGVLSFLGSQLSSVFSVVASDL